MDTSKQYIKMRERAWEIQKLWKPSDWDCCFCKREKAIITLSGYGTDGGYYGHETPRDHLDYYTGSCDDLSKNEYKKWHTWLPRQDQLQEMVEYPDLGSILRDLREFWQRFPNHRITSMEQLWLAFVMKEKHNKIWDGEKWIESTG